MSTNYKLITSLALALGISSAQAATVSVIPADQTVNLGDVFFVNIVGTGFNTPLDAGGINVSYDMSVLTPVVFNAPDDYGDFGEAWTTNFQPKLNGNKLDDIFFFADNAPNGDFDIVTLKFEATGVGSTDITILESLLNPFAGDGNALAVELIDSNVTVTAVPIPAAIWLFGASLVALGSIARRKQQS